MPIDPEMLAALTAVVEKAGGYDLQEQDLGACPVAGWEGLPTHKFGYVRINADGSQRNGRAVMLNPSADQMARWAISAAQFVGAADIDQFARRVVAETCAASGFQFLVRGIHLEDMSGNGYAAYPFFDGVTVQLSSIVGGYPLTPLTASQLDAACTATAADVTKVGKYARVVSTTRAEYTAAGGTGATAGTAWPTRVRGAYQAAWGADSNLLINAAAKARKAEWSQP